VNDDQIRRYLRELDSLLPAGVRRRRRFLAEVEAHLNEAAEDVGPAAALERFGSAREVAEAFGAGNATRSTIVALKLLAAALVVRYAVAFIANLIDLGWPAHRWTLLPRAAALHFPLQDHWVSDLLVFVSFRGDQVRGQTTTCRFDFCASSVGRVPPLTFLCLS
jgi:hypothetical protein